jgi:hypothetical protein
MTVSRKDQSPLKLNILGAVYGLCNVTPAAQSFVTANQEFDKAVSDAVWGDGWPGHKKTLVVVYEYSDISMLEIAVEGDQMHFIASPPLTILGAAYGLKNVTEILTKLLKNLSLKVIANNDTFEDGWRGHDKTLVTVYQYGEEHPSIALVKEKRQLHILYCNAEKDFHGSTNPGTLTILGAAYGPSDVTRQVQSLVKDGSALKFKASNDVFGDTWRGHTKSFVIVYRYGRNTPLMQIAAENSYISVSIPKPRPYADLIDPQNLLEDGDRFALVALNGMFISCDSQLKLVAGATTAEQGCKLTVRKYISTSPFFKIQNETGGFVIVGDGNYLYAAGNKLYFLFHFQNKINCMQSTKMCFLAKLGYYLAIYYRTAMA